LGIRHALQFIKKSQPVPNIYSSAVKLMTLVQDEGTLLRAGYRRQEILEMTMQELRVRALVLREAGRV